MNQLLFMSVEALGGSNAGCLLATFGQKEPICTHWHGLSLPDYLPKCVAARMGEIKGDNEACRGQVAMRRERGQTGRT